MLLISSGIITGQPVQELLPGAADLPGWKMAGPVRVFSGENLFEMINGGADIYLEYGFQQVAAASYSDPYQNIIQAEIYEMSDASAAYGIFSITQQSNAWTEIPGGLLTNTGDYVALWKGKYYVNISWSSRQGQSNPDFAALSDPVISRMPGDFPPALVTRFRTLSPNGNMLYFRGNLALSNFYYIDYKDIFQVSEGIAWKDESLGGIIFRYGDEINVAEVMTQARQSMANSKRFADVTMAYQGFQCTDNKGNRLLSRQNGQYIVFLFGAVDVASLSSSMEAVIRSIENY